MQHFRVSLPERVKAGQTIRIRCPDGSEGDVKVPKGLKGGDSFIFQMPKIELTKGTTKSSFLDRDIASLHDFLTALVVGVIIGFSIVTGFIVGVLVVTDPQSYTYVVSLLEHVATRSIYA